MKIEELSSGLAPNIRKSVLEKFKVSKVNGLICSDSLARGIDIEGVDIVISYNVPRHIKTYIHRIGRTGNRMVFERFEMRNFICRNLQLELEEVA